jgi:GTP-sensing pleiotropic transcriptional regulator CodY
MDHITAECRRRAESGRKFTAYLAQRTLTHDELVAVSDILGRLDRAEQTGDADLMKIAASFTGKAEFTTALEKIDDAGTAGVS